MNRQPRTTMPPKARLISPISDASGPLTKVSEIADYIGVEALIRALDDGARIYDAKGALLGDLADISLRVELLPEGVR